MQVSKARFTVGQLIVHKLFNYRGVIVDVDPVYQGTDEWYEQVALTRPPVDQPWYRVLVHNAFHETYVAERNLQPDETQNPVNHPLVNDYFEAFTNGHYIARSKNN